MKIRKKPPGLLPVGLLLAALLLASACGQRTEGTAEPAQTREYTVEDVTGYWKYDAYRDYLYLASDGIFRYFNPDGSWDEGTFSLEGNLLTFENENYTFDDITAVSATRLVDDEGDVLRRFDPDKDRGFTLDDLSGYWKYDDRDACLALYHTERWETYDIRGSLLDQGACKASGGVISLLNEAGENVLSLRAHSLDQLTDGNGDALSPFDPAGFTGSPVRQAQTSRPSVRSAEQTGDAEEPNPEDGGAEDYSGAPGPEGSDAGGFGEEPIPCDSGAGDYEGGSAPSVSGAGDYGGEEPPSHDSGAGDYGGEPALYNSGAGDYGGESTPSVSDAGGDAGEPAPSVSDAGTAPSDNAGRYERSDGEG